MHKDFLQQVNAMKNRNKIHKKNFYNIVKADETMRLKQAHKLLEDNHDILQKVRVEFTKAYILMVMTHAHFEIASDILSEYDAYNTELLGKSNAVKRTMNDFLDSYEKKMAITLEGFMDSYDILYPKINNILDGKE